MATTDVKEQARRLVEHLPENATWEDLMYEIYVRQAVEAGVADSEATRVESVAAVRARFGLPEGSSSGRQPPSGIRRRSTTA
jgi:hypothetical protein